MIMTARVRNFRGKSTKDGHWVIGTSLSVVNNGDRALIGREYKLDNGHMGFSWEDVRPETVGESIPTPEWEWLNGTALFEDDILQVWVDEWDEEGNTSRSDTYIGVVTLVLGGYEVVAPGKDGGYPLWCRLQEDAFQVLGNKWDNPELLEKEEVC